MAPPITTVLKISTAAQTPRTIQRVNGYCLPVFFAASSASF